MAPQMDAKTQATLREVNRAFYEGTAEAFSASRSHPWPGWERAIAHVKPPEGRAISVLDVGCGNGRFATWLETGLRPRAPSGVRYLGIDSSAKLLDHARTTHAGQEHIDFEERDVLDLPTPFTTRGRRFDLIVAFGVLHHIAGEQARAAFSRAMFSLLEPEGILVVTAWQFGASERFASRVLPWATYNETAEHPVDEAQLEDGDHLLGFATEALPRYCHFSKPDEVRRLLSDSEITWLDRYEADGKTGDLNLYAVLSRAQ